MRELNYLLDICFIRDIVEKNRQKKLNLQLFFSDTDCKAHFYVSSWTISELMSVDKEKRQAIWCFLSLHNAEIVFYEDGVEKHENVTFEKLLKKPKSYFDRNRASLSRMEKAQRTGMIFRICALVGSVFCLTV